MNGGKNLKQLAEETGINYSTLRGYVQRFKEYLPTYKVEGMRWELYEDNASEILKFIAKEYAKDKHIQAIRVALQDAGYSVTVDANLDNNEVMSSSYELGASDPMSTTLHSDDAILSLQQALDLSMKTLKHYQDLARINAELVQEQATTLEALRAEIKILKEKLNQE